MADLRRFSSLKPFAPALWVAAAQLLLGRGLLRGELPFRRDLGLIFVPLKHEISFALRAGRLPQWWPYEALGFPLASQPMASLFHPTTLLYALLPFPAAFDLQLFLPLLLALLGAFRLARALGVRPWAAALTGGVFSLGGYFLSLTEFTFSSLAAAALPWIAFGALRLKNPVRRALGPYTLALAWLFLSGDPVLTYLALATALAFGAPRVGRLLVGTAVAGGLAAVQLLPAALLFSESGRSLGPITAATHWAFGLPQLLGLFTPGPHAAEAHLFPSTYVGALALALALFGGLRRGKGQARLWALLVFSAALASGGALPLWKVMSFLPGWSGLRYPSKAIGPAMLVLALLAGRGASLLGSRRARRFLAPLLAGAVVVELGVVNGWLLETAPPSFWDTPPLGRFLEAHGVSPSGASYVFHWQPQSSSADARLRSAEYAGALFPARGALHGLPSSNAYLPGFSARYAQVSLDQRWRWLGPLAETYGSRFVVAPSTRLGSGEEARVVARDDGAKAALLELAHPLPRAYLTFRAVRLPRAYVPRYLRSGRFAPGKEAVVETEVGSLPSLEEPPANAPEGPIPVHVSAKDGRTEIAVSTERPALLVLNEAFFLGVRAFDAGREVPVFPANHCVRAVALSPGAHRLEFRFETPGLRAGALISLASGLAATAAALRRLRRRRILRAAAPGSRRSPSSAAG